MEYHVLTTRELSTTREVSYKSQTMGVQEGHVHCPCYKATQLAAASVDTEAIYGGT